MTKQTLVVIGNGMVGHKFLEKFCEKTQAQNWNIVTFCEEPRAAYDRVGLSGYFSGKTAAELSLVSDDFFQNQNIEILLNDKAVGIDREAKKVVSKQGREVSYDKLVLATGSFPFVPPVEGKDSSGTFVYRTICDLEAIQLYAKNCKTGVVIGGGLLGLECANALKNLGLETHVIQIASRLMNVQLDDVAGRVLRDKIEALGVNVHLEKSTKKIVADENGRVTALEFADGSILETDLIVFSTGIRPRDEMGKQCGLEMGERGGIRIDNHCTTSDENIFAIGECALHDNRIYGLVAPGYAMASVAAGVLAGEVGEFTGADLSTKLKLMGVDVAVFGDNFAKTPGAREMSFQNPVSGIYKKLVLSPDGKTLIGGILVGDAAEYSSLTAMMRENIALPEFPEDLILPSRDGKKSSGLGVANLPPGAQICSCHDVAKSTLCAAIREDGVCDIGTLKSCTKAGTGCGGCVPLLGDLLKIEMKALGKAVNNHLCEHFEYSRQELYSLVRVHEIKTFDELLMRHGKGRGCEICKPVAASILASTWNEHILEKSHAGLQDTNDRFLANIQKDGTYSVVPRIPGGEITPEKLIVIGEVAKEFGLYTKITGGQRIDLFGAQLHELPVIWKKLIDAGFESGHAYGKALRTVKSCVGSTWCRYGVQDSVGLAIEIEERYRGLRAPHKIKCAVSGCTRECAEAQSKDIGVIATENGYNLYLCGNGGMKPQHAVLFANDLDRETLIQYCDRFLMFYIRTADRLQRTATWLNNLEGGVEYLRQVVMEDSLGLAEELEDEMQYLVSTYECEWKKAIENPEKARQFRHFVNAEARDGGVVFVSERSQIRPATGEEKAGLTLDNFIPLSSLVA